MRSPIVLLLDLLDVVRRHMALLRGKSEEEVKEELWGNKKPRRKLHPAEKLTPAQMKEIGFKGPGWYALRKRNLGFYRRTLDWVWAEWKKYVDYEKETAYMRFIVAKNSEERKVVCREYAKKLSLDCLEILMEFVSYKVASSKNKPSWVIETERFVQALKKTS